MKTRFCPSPTGFMHLGNARTAAFSYLLAKSQDGKFLLRIEDTDKERSKKEFSEQIFKDLNWLGLDWDEGPMKGSENAPYFQSDRNKIYEDYFELLVEKHIAYPCFCTPEQLALSRKLQRSRGVAPKYAGTCRDLTPVEIAEKRTQKLAETLRFKVADHQEIRYEDYVKGPHLFLSDDIGDFIIRKADGAPTFFFCNAVDDALMGVTHVLRGEDHVTNTPRQILILEALNLPVPAYGHIALILGEDGAPLSKRNGSLSIMELREKGYLPIAVMNAMARLGHYYSEDRLLDFQELAKFFKIASLSKSPARFDRVHLDHWQNEAVTQLTDQEFKSWIAESLASIPENRVEAFIQTIRANVRFPNEVREWYDCFFAEKINYSSEQQELLQAAPGIFFEAAIAALEHYGVDYEKIIEQIKTQSQLKGKNLFKPLRIALTGREDGMELHKIIEFLGKDKAIQRLTVAHGD